MAPPNKNRNEGMCPPAPVNGRGVINQEDVTLVQRDDGPETYRRNPTDSTEWL